MSDELQRITVLLVDDEENILRSLQRLLMDEEFEIELATSGEAALEKLRNLENVGLIVSDQRMPGMNGAEFLGRSQEIAPHAVRILLTGYSDISATIAAINQGGASRYLSKPWNDDELVQVIRDAVRQYALIAENIRLNSVIARQNEELQEWNSNLKARVLQQTTAIRKKSEEVQSALEQVREDYHGMIAVLSGFMEMRGEDVLQHARKVTELSVNVAREMNLPADVIETIKTAGLLHDIGEIGISDRILMQTPENMSRDDFSVYSQHPIRGQMALINIEGLRPVGTLIRHHHENFDGSGYPNGLAGEAIPLGSRIIGFADKLTHISRGVSGDIAEASMGRIELMLGSFLDPALFRIFKKIAKYSFFTESSPDHSKLTVLEYELRPEELKEGMTLSRSLISGTGMLLLYRGLELDTKKIQAIRNYYELDAPKKGIFVKAKLRHD
jgi:response regulator RpfG family c-di-GMP phosphodiesterase